MVLAAFFRKADGEAGGEVVPPGDYDCNIPVETSL